MADVDPTERPQTQQIFVRADEVDAGTSILSPSRQLPLSALTPTDSAAPVGTARPKAPPRPGLRRDGSAPPPPPPSQPPPAPPGPPEVTDSLSLPQLRQLVSQFPKTEQRAYAFQYAETDEYETEIDEWFQYSELDQDRECLLASREAFEQAWRSYCQDLFDTEDASWMEVEQSIRVRFVRARMSAFEGSSGTVEDLGCLFYILTGTWSITSGLNTSHCSEAFRQRNPELKNDDFKAVQLEWMHRGADMLHEAEAVVPLYDRVKSVAESMLQARHLNDKAPVQFDHRELSLGFSCFYLLVESARQRKDEDAGKALRKTLTGLSPSFPVLLTTITSVLRWDESFDIPLIHAIQLLWKLLLLSFGDVQNDLEAVRAVLQPRIDPFSADASRPTLTASPLDYHLFRQEITSKYPAYNPPLPLIPLESEQRTMLPVLPQYSNKPESLPGANSAAANVAAGTSILHQPVHIATPAPSPPPSPAGPGGKVGKKQNYQTNQNFPFLYPPLDPTSNDLGGKGSTEIQDLMVGKKWEGSDVPTSIIEAGELFASRMRMTRAMRQLWRQRDLFMKYDRGWRGDQISKDKDNDLQDQIADEAAEDLDSLADADLRERMVQVERFFHGTLADMQSFVIVLMKAMLSNVQDIAVRNGNFADSQASSAGGAGGLNRTKSNSNVGGGGGQAANLPMPPPAPKPTELSFDELDNIRSREISQKAIAGVLFSLLKWFKMSHVLKFEYFTQLLLDSNYVQLTLKYFAHQNLEDIVAFRYDREDFSFWRYCHAHSDHPPLSPTSPAGGSDGEGAGKGADEGSDDSADDAVPPPIARRRRSSPPSGENVSTDLTANDGADASSAVATGNNPSHPSVDELGNPISPLPQSPITTFSSRQFQTSIHLLRTLQKVTRGKSHRILLLVQFKSSQILRRVLRVPDTTLRLYVLKLFKAQVPYCGRKWRQSNMRVITAIYLHCRPELRDEWLAGMHDTSVEGEVEEAVPLEWALRGLTFWWLRRGWGDVMGRGTGGSARNGQGKKKDDGDEVEDEGEDWTTGGGQEIEVEERDFFQRELDAMGWGVAGLLGSSSVLGDEVAFGEEAPGAHQQSGVVNFNGTGGGAAASIDSGWADAATLEAWQNSNR
jgi:hypothetical protein